MPKNEKRIVKVLLAEDLPSDAELEIREIKAALGECTFRVVETREAFIDTLKEFQPDLIISDYKMPSFDGLSALRLARESNPEIPFIIATGSMNEDTAVACMKAGADDYVIKEHIKRLSSAAINALKQAQERIEKNRMQAALLESEDKFKYVFENSAVGKSLTKPNGEMQVNKSVCEMLGYTAEEMQGIKWQDITHPDDVRASQKMVDDLLSGKTKTFRIEKRYFKKDGSIVWVDLRTTLRRDQDGNPQYFMTTISDITERVEARLALQNSEKQFRSFFEVASVGIVQADIKGRVVQCNKAYSQITGFGMAELQNVNFSEYTHPEDREADFVLFNQLVAGKIPNYSIEKRYIHKNGKIIWVRLNIAHIQDGQGNIVGSVSVVEDITKNVQARETLAQSERRFRSFFEVASLGIAQTDPREERYLRCNEAYARITGYSQSELIGMSFQKLTHPDDRQRDLENYQKSVSSGANAFQIEKRFIKKDGSTIWVSVNGANIRDTQGEVISSIAIVEDITQRKMDEEELLKLQRAVEQSPSIVVITDTKPRVEYVNRKFTELTGYTLDEVRGKNPSMWKGGDKTEKEYKQMWDMLLAGQEWRGEFQNKKKNGALYWESVLLSPVRSTAGSITHFIAMKEDITQKKVTDAELHASESKYHSVIENSADAIVLTDPHGMVIEWNPAAERLLRTPRVAALGQPLWDVQFNAYGDTSDTPDAYERLKKSVLDMRTTGKSPILNQLREQELRFKDGSVITIESIAFIFDKSADGWHVGSITRDVSERKKKEEEVRQSETKFRTLFTNMVSGACVDEVIYQDGKVVDYRILDINPSYERILGTKRENVVGELASKIYAPHPVPFLDTYAQVVESGKPQEFEAFFPPAAKYVHITVSSPAPGRFSTIFSDITEQRQAAEALHLKIQELEQFHDLTVDRELRMIELKREVNSLMKELGKEQKYKGAN